VTGSPSVEIEVEARAAATLALDSPGPHIPICPLLARKQAPSMIASSPSGNVPVLHTEYLPPPRPR